MILFIDIGNSRIKWAYRKNASLKCAFVRQGSMLTHAWEQAVDVLLMGPHPERIYVANVVNDAVVQGFNKAFLRRWSCAVQVLQTRDGVHGLKLAYNDPQQLGVDRWLAMIGALSLGYDSFLLAGCGSAVTVDLVFDGKLHQGGVIVPGLKLLRQSLHQGVHGVHSSTAMVVDGLGCDTAQCVNLGADYAVSGMIEYLFQHIGKAQRANLQCVLTGGDAVRIAEKLTIDSDRRPELIFQGMAQVLNQR